MNLKDHLISSIEGAESNTSKIGESILSLEGMTGVKTRHFYNNICNMTDARYLEIGSWRGSSICSAIYENDLSAVCIDDFSEFNEKEYPGDTLRSNIKSLKGDNNIRFIESNCWDIDVSSLPKFNIYMYDGDHSEESQFRALEYFLDCLDDEFIFIVDDWNWDQVENGTRRAINDLNVETVFEKEIKWRGSIEVNEWWNGVGTFVLRKTTK